MGKKEKERAAQPAILNFTIKSLMKVLKKKKIS